MFSNSLTKHFEEDPFFEFKSYGNDFFRNTDSMLDQMHRPQITDGRQRGSREVAPRSNHPARSRDNMMMPFNFESPMAHVQDMFGGMQRMMQDSMTRFDSMANDPNADVNSYCSSSFYSYNGAEGGEPKVYQAHRSLRTQPGGIREEQKAMRDSLSGEERMHLGQYIGERGRRLDKRRNTRSGATDENNEYIGLEEEEADSFNADWGRHNSDTRGRHQGREPRVIEHHESSRRPGGRREERDQAGRKANGKSGDFENHRYLTQ